jgi:hypothetical protein
VDPGSRLEFAHERPSVLDHQVRHLERREVAPALRFRELPDVPGRLREALHSGADETLAQWLVTPGIVNSHEQSHRNGVPFTKKVPSNASSTLAEGEFNRFYLRGLCARALNEGAKVEIYRGRISGNPRTESEYLIGQVLEPAQLVRGLRSSVGGDTALGLPPGPNSGLTAKLR